MVIDAAAVAVVSYQDHHSSAVIIEAGAVAIVAS
jgi:hypothetical protein